MKTIKEIKKEVYEKALEEVVRKLATIELDILVCENIEENVIITRKPMGFSSDGKPTSWQDITAKDLLPELRNQAKDLQVRVDEIIKLLN